jgi:uncharacterized protein (TIGR03086 family)
MSDLAELYERSIEEFDKRVQAIDDDKWNAQTACSDWDVRTLVNHIVYENVWVPPLLDGKTIAEVGDAFEGDLLGDDPKEAWRRSAKGAIEAVAAPGVKDRTVHVSFGDIPGELYVGQVLSDNVIHAWDLAQGIGADLTLDPELVDYVYDFLTPQAEIYRSSGAFANVIDVPEDADKQTRLLAMTGRRAL